MYSLVTVPVVSSSHYCEDVCAQVIGSKPSDTRVHLQVVEQSDHEGKNDNGDIETCVCWLGLKPPVEDTLEPVNQ